MLLASCCRCSYCITVVVLGPLVNLISLEKRFWTKVLEMFCCLKSWWVVQWILGYYQHHFHSDKQLPLELNCNRLFLHFDKFLLLFLRKISWRPQRWAATHVSYSLGVLILVLFFFFSSLVPSSSVSLSCTREIISEERIFHSGGRSLTPSSSTAALWAKCKHQQLRVVTVV